MTIILANFGKYAISDCPFIGLFVHLFATILKDYDRIIIKKYQESSDVIYGTVGNMFLITTCIHVFFYISMVVRL